MARNVNPEVAARRARVAGLVKVNADPERIEAARAELSEANAEAAVQKIVAEWPPLSAETRAKLACILLAPAGDGDAT